MWRNRRLRFALLAGLGALVFSIVLLYRFLFADLPSPGQMARLPAESTLIVDRQGRTLYEAIAANGNKHVPLSLSQIPLACRQAAIATEDSRFYEHPGVDLLAIARAAWRNWRGEGPFSGASTLSQQLARTLYLSEDERGERTLRRKLREAWLAWRLERRTSKDELLALYLNTAYYGHFAVGIEAAAQSYFGVHARELDLAQCALLAGLLQYPGGYNPLENSDAAVRRQRVVLDLMIREGYIVPAQADEAHQEQLSYASTPFPIEAPHFVMWVQRQVEALLGDDRARSGGLRVITTLDLDWQRQAEAIVARRLAALRPCAFVDADPTTCDRDADATRRVDNAGLVALDPQTGAVLAMVGNADYFDRSISGAVNTTLALRQPGSAIKPLTYALALDPMQAAAAGRAPWTPATLIADLRTVFVTAEGLPYVPQNYDHVFHGPITLRTALANSYNIPAVKTLEYVGVDALIALANRLGIPWEQEIGDWKLEVGKADSASSIQPPSSSLQPPTSKFGLALTLGGGEVRLLDLTAAYAAFAIGGQRVVPFAISRIESLDGEVIVDCSHAECANPQSAIANPQSIDPRVAYLITDILSDDEARRPAFGVGSALEIGRPAAVKTGTTTDWRDNWTVGYTPDLVVGVWTGNADNTPMRGVSGVTGAAPIWHDFMSSVLRGTPSHDFDRPDGLVQVEVCSDSGLLPADSKQPSAINPQSVIPNPQSTIVPCSARRLEWFIAGAKPTKTDASHVQIAIDARTGAPATAATPAEYLTKETFWLLPPEFREWAREAGMPQPTPGERRRTKDEMSSVVGPPSSVLLTSPDPNRTYRLDLGLPPSSQKLPITAWLGPQFVALDASVTLLVDSTPFAVVYGPDYTAWWPLKSGQHTLQAVANGPDGQVANSEPITVFVVE